MNASRCFPQIRQRWACQATLHTCSALQKPPDGLTDAKPAPLPPSEAFDTAGRPSKLPASALGAPLLSRLEPEIGSENFGIAVRMACADASAPYKLPLLDQHMFPDGEAMLPVCLVQRYERPEEERVGVVVGGGGGIGGGRPDGRMGGGRENHPVSPRWGVPTLKPALGRASTLPTDFPSPPTPILPFRKRNSLRGDSSPRNSTAPVSPAVRVARPVRAASSSPRARHSRVATINSATAAAAVAAAVAAAIPFAADDDGDDDDDEGDDNDKDNDHSTNGSNNIVHDNDDNNDNDDAESSSPSPPPVPKRRPRGVGRHHRSRSAITSGSGRVTPMSAEAAAAAAAAGGRAEAPVREVQRGKSTSSLSPLKHKGRTFFAPRYSRWPSFRSPTGTGDSERRRAAAGASPAGERTCSSSAAAGGGDSVGRRGRRKDYCTDGSPAGGNLAVNGHHPRKSFTERAADQSSSATAVASEGQSPALGMVSPTTPQRPPRRGNYSSPRPQRRGAGEQPGGAGVMALVPPSPMRRSPLASPARPPLKPMDAEQDRCGGGGGMREANANASSIPIATANATAIANAYANALSNANDDATADRSDRAVRSAARGGAVITRGSDGGGGATRGAFRSGSRGENLVENRGADGGASAAAPPAVAASAAGSAGVVKRDNGGAGSSLLDGVEQSSDLGAFFRRGEGQLVRRGRGNFSPRRRSPRLGSGGGSSCTLESQECEEGEYEEDEEGEEEEDEEERENRRGAGVGVHVVVLHHGYCGSSMDMRLIKNYIRILAPDVLVLNAESNERDQHTSMKVMGERLAKDVHR